MWFNRTPSLNPSVRADTRQRHRPGDVRHSVAVNSVLARYRALNIATHTPTVRDPASSSYAHATISAEHYTLTVLVWDYAYSSGSSGGSKCSAVQQLQLQFMCGHTAGRL